MASNHPKEPKRKPKYGMFSCVAYIFKLLWDTERRLAFTAVCSIPISVLLAAVTLYTPSLILSTLEASEHFSYIALVILGLLLAGLLMELVNNALERSIYYSEFYILMRFLYLLGRKKRYRDYYHSYRKEVQETDARARTATMNNHSRGVQFPMDFSRMVTALLKFALFGTIISTLHPVILLFLAAGSILTFYMKLWEKKANWSGMDIYNSLMKKLTYWGFGKGIDSKCGKDIRLYTMGDFLHQLTQNLLLDTRHELIKMEKRSMIAVLVSLLVILFRDGLAYAFLIYKAAAGEMDAASFVLYFSAITSISSFMTEILNTWTKITQGTLELSDFREALELEDHLNHGPGIPVPTKPFSIEFRNVSFKYPDGEKKILDNVSFKIEPGEKIALVGLNGAGKTTLTMLMCGMLLPDEGEILLDGHSLISYNRDEMYGLFGFVPQNYSLLPVSISQNITCTLEEEEIDQDKLRHCIDLAGLTEKIRSLPLGIQTPLNRSVHKNAVELSGGEIQKLLLARLLYKNPLCIILDEPTAALDPLAEHRMYCKYNEISANTTSIFISHRLASTRFCDRIFLLDGARFTEEGTHEELMRAGQKYRELFDVQSKYYQEGAAFHEE